MPQSVNTSEGEDSVKIEGIELLEIFLDTVCHVAEVHDTDQLPLPSRGYRTTLADLQGNAESIIINLAERYQTLDDSSLAQATRQLADVMNRNTLMSRDETEGPGRCLDYVYPVV